MASESAFRAMSEEEREIERNTPRPCYNSAEEIPFRSGLQGLSAEEKRQCLDLLNALLDGNPITRSSALEAADSDLLSIIPKKETIAPYIHSLYSAEEEHRDED